MLLLDGVLPLYVFPSLSLPDIYIFLELSKMLPYNECVRGSHEELTMKNAGEGIGTLCGGPSGHRQSPATYSDQPT